MLLSFFLTLYYKLYIYVNYTFLFEHVQFINYFCTRFQKLLLFNDVIRENVILINIPWMFSKPVKIIYFLNHVFFSCFYINSDDIFKCLKLSEIFLL